jgi:phosphatidylinositol alpha-1,6-mannosyltransferase
VTHSPQRFLVLTPSLSGADGVSALSRLVVRALAGPHAGVSATDVVALAESPAHASAWQLPGVRIIGAGGRKGRFVAAALGAGWRRARHTDVVCVHLHQSPVALPLLARGARLTTLLCGIEAWKPLRPLERRALLRSTHVIAISAHTAQRFRDANPRCAHRAVQVCHLALSDADAAAPQDASAADGAPLAALIVGRMAAAERYKGHDLLLDLWPRVTVECPEARLIVVGDGDDRPRLQARAATSGLGERVTFTGRVSDDELTALYSRCSFFVMPSPAEGFGFVFLEAMRAGKACIGAPGAAAEVIQDEVTGLIVDPRHPDAVLRAIVRLFREPATRARMGRAGAARVVAHFTEAHFRQRFGTLLGLHPGAPGAPCTAL